MELKEEEDEDGEDKEGYGEGENESTLSNELSVKRRTPHISGKCILTTLWGDHTQLFGGMEGSLT